MDYDKLNEQIAEIIDERATLRIERNQLRRALEKACAELGSLIGLIKCPSTSPEDCTPWEQKPDMYCQDCWQKHFMEDK